MGFICLSNNRFRFDIIELSILIDKEMSANTIKKLQQRLYQQAKSSAKELGVADGDTIIAYSKKFEQSLPSKFRKIERSDFFSYLSDAKMILYGDFHTLRQSQKGFVRLMQELAKFHPQQKCLIAMEMFKVKDQVLLESFLAQQLSEQEFLQRIDYENSWGFPWPNYRMIIDYARRAQIPVFAINSDAGGRDKLPTRDELCATMLKRLALQYRGYQIFCIVGEYHLADQQLPALLINRRTNRKIVRVVSNIDQYYFSLNFPPEFTISHYLYLKKDLFCIMDTPPWVKWQSYNFWEEQRDNSKQFEAREGFYNELQLDLDYHFLSLVSDLVRFFAFTDNSTALSRFHLISGTPQKIITEVQRRRYADNKTILKHAVVRLAVDGFYFLENSKTILLAKVSLNNLAEMAGQFLYEIIAPSPTTASPTDRFYRRVIRFTIGVLCSKIINPKRKLTNYYRYVDIAQGQVLAEQEQREIARQVIRFHEWLSHRVTHCQGRIVRHLSRAIVLDEQVNFEISKSLSKVIGVRIYRQTLYEKKIPTTELRDFFTKGQQSWQTLVEMYRYFCQT